MPGADNAPVLWLYGTIHDAGIEAVPPHALAALDHAARFASELGNVDPDPADMRELAFDKHGSGLPERLGDDWFELHTALHPFIRDDDLARAKPWYAMSLLTTHTDASTAPPMDGDLAKRARAKDLPVDALETWRDQLTALDASVSLDDLREVIHQRRDVRCALSQMRVIYDAGDLDDMTKLLIVPRTADTLVWARNRAWMPKLEGYLASSGGFVAVGLAHLIGDNGLPAMLARAGYTVTR